MRTAVGVPKIDRLDAVEKIYRCRNIYFRDPMVNYLFCHFADHIGSWFEPEPFEPQFRIAIVNGGSKEM